ncbi:MAG TPA: DUF5522 domain-containing protein [Flavitalea sp.]|nr:DUF5522 domain-containing protein [Flavitalea sp.]
MKNKLIEGVDYYLNEDGLMVFTAKYHLDRGSCCGNGCKHCPYKKLPSCEGGEVPKARGGCSLDLQPDD